MLCVCVVMLSCFDICILEVEPLMNLKYVYIALMFFYLHLIQTINHPLTVPCDTLMLPHK